MIKVTITPPAKRIRASELAVGEIGVSDNGVILLRVYNLLISLDDPRNTFTPACGEWVERVPSGSTISFVVP